MMEDLGSGFYLAMHDLEIRGAGEVLGESQSGEMQEVGFQLYADMLKAAVSALKAGREPDLSAPLGVATEINLHVPSLLPSSYCSDVHERLVLYKRLANCETADELQSMAEELVDRFGRPPEPAQALIACHRLRLIAKPKGIAKVDAGPERSTLQFVKAPPFDPASLIAIVQKDGRVRFAGPDRIRIERAAPTLPERVAVIREFVGSSADTALRRAERDTRRIATLSVAPLDVVGANVDMNPVAPGVLGLVTARIRDAAGLPPPNNVSRQSARPRR